MGTFLKDAKARETANAGEVLKVAKNGDGKAARVKCGDKVIAVCEQSDGQYVLARERDRNKVGADGKRSEGNGTERYFKRTAMLADYADAAEHGLL